LNHRLIVVKEISFRDLTRKEQDDAKREVAFLSQFDHVNIVAYYGNFMHRNVFHIIMEYADDGDLRKKILASGPTPISEDQILDWFTQICYAVKHVHDNKVIHRDLKPENIFLMKSGIVKLGDFGVAITLQEAQSLPRKRIGTPYYLSPEIWDRTEYTFRTDVWSLGCILYELCAGTTPFEAPTDSDIQIKIRHCERAPLPEYYSSKLRGLVDKLLERTPERRPTIDAILALDFIRDRRVVTAREEALRRI
jgi:NIMA (never in mitosis gene a)-related kinase